MDNIVMITQDNCKFCKKAGKLLTSKALDYTTINLSDTLDPNQDLKSFLRMSGIKTVPAIFIAGVYLGGYTELKGRLL